MKVHNPWETIYQKWREKMKNLSCPISVKQIEFIKNFYIKKTAGPDGFTGKYSKRLSKVQCQLYTDSSDNLKKKKLSRYFMILVFSQ